MTDEISEALGRMSDRIVNLTLHDEIQWIDVVLQTQEMREFCRQHAPDRLELFEMIYPPRFERIWRTFGPPTRPPQFG